MPKQTPTFRPLFTVHKYFEKFLSDIHSLHYLHALQPERTKTHRNWQSEVSVYLFGLFSLSIHNEFISEHLF